MEVLGIRVFNIYLDEKDVPCFHIEFSSVNEGKYNHREIKGNFNSYSNELNDLGKEGVKLILKKLEEENNEKASI